mgnify:CR=1 FL=1
MDGKTDGQAYRWTDRQMDRRMDTRQSYRTEGQTNEWTDGQCEQMNITMNGHTDGRKDRSMDKLVYRNNCTDYKMFKELKFYVKKVF